MNDECHTHFIINFLESVVLVGEGEYNLNVVKEIEVTDSYMGLDQDVRGCQNKETYNDCTTKVYIDTVIDTCGCLPFNIMISNQARVICRFVSFSKSSIFLQTSVCSPDKVSSCVESMKIDNSKCLPSCEGLMITSFAKFDNDKEAESVMRKIFDAYRTFKGHLKFPKAVKGR